jgi:PRELI-like family.
VITLPLFKFNLFQSVIEKVEYKVSDENENWTLAKRSVWIDSKMYGFSLAIQKFGLERYKKNILKMTNGFNFILNAMFPNVLQQNANLASTMSSTNQNFAINPDKLKEKAKKVTSDFATKSSKLLNVPNPS